MIDYGLKDRVALITGANNPQGIGATTAFAFAREGAKVVLVYKRIPRHFDKAKTDRNGADRYYQANAGNADVVESKLQKMGATRLSRATSPMKMPSRRSTRKRLNDMGKWISSSTMRLMATWTDLIPLRKSRRMSLTRPLLSMFVGAS